MYGDVSGANIDIASKELEKSSVLSISVGNGFNSNAIKTSKFLVSEGTNYFGFSFSFISDVTYDCGMA